MCSTEILVRLIEDHGGTALTNKMVQGLIVENGRCVGVECADGSSYRAEKAVLSTIHIKHLIDMASRDAWADDFVEGVETWQGGPTLFVQHYATSEPMTFKGDGGNITPIACAMLSEPTRALRMGYDFARGVANVEEPVLLAVSPTIGDPSQAPPGHHTIKIIGMQPYDLKEGPQHWDSIKDEVAEANLNWLRKFSPNLTDDKILARVVESPLDLERRNPHNWHGSCHGGAQNAAQAAALRPAAGWAQHRMPIAGLYQTGSTTYPGGSISGGPGRNAATVMLKDFGRSSRRAGGRPKGEGRGATRCTREIIDLGRNLMKRILSFVLGAVATIATGVVSTAPVLAQSWPTQRVTVVVPFGAGSVTDILARIFAEEMGKRWGQQVVVENRPGLAGTTAVGKSTPDGYTLMVTSNGHTVAGLVSKTLTVDPVKDFAGITRLGSAALFLITPPDFQAKTLNDIIALAKKEPGKLNFSSPGLASTTFIAGALFRKQAGIDIVHVPFKSAPDAVTAVMRGDAQMYFAPVNLARDQSAAGKVNAIAAATANRIPEMPNTPTFTEAGLPFVYDFVVRPDGAARCAEGGPRQDCQGLGGGNADAGDEGQARFAVPDRRERYAGADGQADCGRDREIDPGVQGGGHLSSPRPIGARAAPRCPRAFFSFGAVRRDR